MILEIQAACTCGRKLARMPAGDSATFVCRRTCPRCKAAWQVTVSPAMRLGGDTRMHAADLFCVAGSVKA